MDDIKAGIYRHYKGRLYLVMGLAHDANADTLVPCRLIGEDQVEFKAEPLGDRTVVLYIGLQLDDAHTGPRLAVRTYDDFFALVCTRREHRHYGAAVTEEDRVPCTAVTRFTYIGPTYERSEVGI